MLLYSMSITSIITDVVAVLGGVTAVLYGLFRWRKFGQFDELLWCGYGACVVAVMAWVFFSHFYLPDTDIIGWSRPALMLLVAVCGIPVYFWHQKKPY